MKDDYNTIAADATLKGVKAVLTMTVLMNKSKVEPVRKVRMRRCNLIAGGDFFCHWEYKNIRQASGREWCEQ